MQRSKIATSLSPMRIKNWPLNGNQNFSLGNVLHVNQCSRNETSVNIFHSASMHSNDDRSREGIRLSIETSLKLHVFVCRCEADPDSISTCFSSRAQILSSSFWFSSSSNFFDSSRPWISPWLENKFCYWEDDNTLVVQIQVHERRGSQAVRALDSVSV